MKKFLFFLATFCLVLVSSCCNKPTRTEKNICDGYTLVGVSTNDTIRYGLNKGTHVILTPEYDTIVWNKNLKAFLAYTGKQLKIADKNGNFPNYELYDSVVTDGKYWRMVNKKGVSYYNPETKDMWDTFEDIVICEPFVFLKEKGHWGMYTRKHSAVLGRLYNNIYYFPSAKSDSIYNVVSNANGKWQMFSTDGSMSRLSSKYLKKKVDACKPTSPVGYLNLKIK